MDLAQRINAWKALGLFLQDFNSQNYQAVTCPLNYEIQYYTELAQLITRVQAQNAWFTDEAIRFSLTQWGILLQEENLLAWLSAYTIENNAPKRIGLILAGNIPLVGLHDVLCTLITGHYAIIKYATQDNLLIPFLLKLLILKEPQYKTFISVAETTLTQYDAVIATGNNNTARYFEYYFAKKPHIIRKNRTSVAVLSGTETPEMLRLLGEDIFCYFGLGCRNVSHLFVPRAYDFTLFFDSIYTFSTVMDNYKYAHNYDYYKAIYLLNKAVFLDNNFLMIKESPQLKAAVGTLLYSYYDNVEQLNKTIEIQQEAIQCVVTNIPIPRAIPLGTSQMPSLNQYADEVDTIAFLLKINTIG